MTTEESGPDEGLPEPSCEVEAGEPSAPSALGPDPGEGPESPRERFVRALHDEGVAAVASRLLGEAGHFSLDQTLTLAHALASACGDEELSERLSAERSGYPDGAEDVPEERRVTGFASPFPVRALDLGLLDPEEIFSAHNEKFSSVKLTIGQSVGELEQALGQIRAGGVLVLKVPASEVTALSADTSADTEVYIYVLPAEIEAIVGAARALAVRALTVLIIRAAAG